MIVYLRHRIVGNPFGNSSRLLNFPAPAQIQGKNEKDIGKEHAQKHLYFTHKTRENKACPTVDLFIVRFSQLLFAFLAQKGGAFRFAFARGAARQMVKVQTDAQHKAENAMNSKSHVKSSATF